jgi:hypothetical protein
MGLGRVEVEEVFGVCLMSGRSATLLSPTDQADKGRKFPAILGWPSQRASHGELVHTQN